METIVVQTENEEQGKLVKAFLEQHNLKSRVLRDEDKEDMVLGRLMEDTNYSEIVDTDTFLNKLRG